MKTWLAATLTLLLAVRLAPAQERENLWSDPAIPPREVLERLNLELAWHVALPMDGRRDSIVSIQHTGRQLIAQTRAGLLALHDAETGKLVWRVRLGDPYRVALPTAFNSTSIFVVNGTVLYALDRSNGILQWQLTMPGSLAAPPVADEEQVYLITSSGAVFAYRPATVEIAERLAPYPIPPSYGAIDVSAVKKSERIIEAIRPVPRWDADTRLRPELPAVQSSEILLVADPRGVLVALSKTPTEGFSPEAYRFPLETSLFAGPGAFDTLTYFPGRDGYVYAFDMARGRIQWRRLVTSAALTRTPIATQLDLYVVSEREGMARLDRETGDPLWRIPRGNRLVPTQAEADRFLAASPKFVYALDKSGRLVILDRVRGLVLSRLDVRDYVFPVVNEQTDRLYLAANNGLIVCLRDIDYPKPVGRKLSEKEEAAGKSPDDRARELKERLTKPVSFDAGEPQPLRLFLETLRRNYGIKSFISEKGFKENNIPPPLDLKIKVPKVDKVPLLKVIQDILIDVNATALPLGDQLFIIPKPKGAPLP